MKSTGIRRAALACAAAVWAAAAAGPAQAEIKNAKDDSFLITFKQTIPAPPAKVFESIGKPNLWWNSAHSWSSNAANLSLPLEAGGCFCERWDGGSVEHGRVVMIMKNQVVRLASALGPLQGKSVSAMLTFSLKPEGAGTELSLTYLVNGASGSALDKSAGPVDHVVGEQFERLVRYVETGNPAAPAAPSAPATPATKQ